MDMYTLKNNVAKYKAFASKLAPTGYANAVKAKP